MAMPSRLSMLERAGRHKQTALDPLARADAAREDAYAGIARQGFLDQEARGRVERRGANDPLRGSGFGQFFDALEHTEAEAAFDGKGFRVGPMVESRPSRLSRLSMLERPAAPISGGRITVQGPRRDPDLPVFAPADFQDMREGGGVSARGARGGTVASVADPSRALAVGRMPGDPNVPSLLDSIRTGRVASERQPVLDAAETEAATAFVPSAVKMREEQTRVKELIERIKAAAGIQEAEIGAGASRYSAEQRAAATRDAARIRSTRPGPDRLDRANTLNSLYNSGALRPGERPKDPGLAALYDWLLESGMAGQAGPGGPGGGDDLDSMIDQLLDENPDLTDEEIMAIIGRGGQ